jgi:hypothetical protein
VFKDSQYVFRAVGYNCLHQSHIVNWLNWLNLSLQGLGQLKCKSKLRLGFDYVDLLIRLWSWENLLRTWNLVVILIVPELGIHRNKFHIFGSHKISNIGLDVWVTSKLAFDRLWEKLIIWENCNLVLKNIEVIYS